MGSSGHFIATRNSSLGRVFDFIQSVLNWLREAQAKANACHGSNQRLVPVMIALCIIRLQTTTCCGRMSIASRPRKSRMSIITPKAWSNPGLWCLQPRFPGVSQSRRCIAGTQSSPSGSSVNQSSLWRAAQPVVDESWPANARPQVWRARAHSASSICGVAGSISPERVDMTNPSSGVKPIVVSIGWPWRHKVMLAPEPRWRVMADIVRTDRSSFLAA